MNSDDLPIRVARKRWRVLTDKITTPPVARAMLFFHRRKPVLPEYRADILRRRLRKGIASKEVDYVRVLLQQVIFGKRDDLALIPARE